ncbi:MAG: DNA primase [Candidatus Hydrothermarchaeota archaeon]|nr:MAG: DNA primase [Candidatus Hydrothermarchaeota archaeon]RLG58854.1 MAG: DNA primase [Candidatus Hydrothermarchaeota archaeon]
MGKIDLGTTKYVIHASIETDGIVEKPDVVGAIFGQTEGLLGNELDLRELQKTGRIGRIEVHIESRGGKSRGTIQVPSSLDKVETAILAAALETIDRVGPCDATIKVDKIEDVRVSKRKRVIERAKEILTTMVEEITPDSLEITEEVKEAIRLQEIREFGEDRLPAGPNVEDSDAVIIVEGRADVLNLLKHGIKNAIAVEGTSIPKTIIDLCKEKTVTVFTDGDRGGELIIKELIQVADVDFIARAPPGKEVEELTKKEIFKSLRNKIPVEQYIGGKLRKPREAVHVKKEKDEKIEKYKKYFSDISGTLKAYLLDEQENIIKEVAVRDLPSALEDTKEKVSVAIFDGVITQRLVDIASEKGVGYLIGAKIGNIDKKPVGIKLLTAEDLEA